MKKVTSIIIVASMFLSLQASYARNYGRNYPCSGKKGGVSHCTNRGKYVCNDGTVSKSKYICHNFKTSDVKTNKNNKNGYKKKK